MSKETCTWPSIRMSKDMQNFNAEGAGEIMFNKVVNRVPNLGMTWNKDVNKELPTTLFKDASQTPKTSKNHNLPPRTPISSLVGVLEITALAPAAYTATDNHPCATQSILVHWGEGYRPLLPEQKSCPSV
ncbi:uncharacterized protein BDR25DRAFT_319230 [Lindgomyces ingoldianus]|uniref:Uncharacterized protein n=1 Tax=Lindgomyces ingoldianus TaxID=673940 RepID=A0ACB6QEG4_9PLEO|nr:uncharacterized protein BDR25DRAFT_319230 [Lindgomyces ingoldianus]KAF2464512.1 hypothetical protein BDR25DRAFT_319230 [Lindgomyces ingoldianus]